MNHTSNGVADFFIQKLDSNGNLVWVKTIGGSNYDHGISIDLDPNGNIYATGNFAETTDFDPGPGISNVTAGMYGNSIFILKLDASGNFLWVKTMGTWDWFCTGRSIATDPNGNVCITGEFRGSLDFDPGVGALVLSSNSYQDIFILKLDGGGNLLWATSMGAQSGSDPDVGYSISTDVNGNVFTTGKFSGTIDFDPGVGISNLASSGQSSIFIQKLDSSGNFLWAKAIGGSTWWDSGRSITTDASGNVYTTGTFGATVDFDPGVDTMNLSSNGGIDIFIQKLDSSGNFLWAKAMGGTGHDYGYSIATDTSGNVFTTGEFEATVDFDPGAGTLIFTSSGLAADIFYQKLDSNGDLLWATKIGGTSDDVGKSITSDGNGNIYSTGYFGSTVDFDPGAGTFNLVEVGGNEDVFIQKFSPGNTVGFLVNKQDKRIAVYPNPTEGMVTVLLSNAKEAVIAVRNIHGQLVLRESVKDTRNLQVQLEGASGLYTVEVMTVDGVSEVFRVLKE